MQAVVAGQAAVEAGAPKFPSVDVGGKSAKAVRKARDAALVVRWRALPCRVNANPTSKVDGDRRSERQEVNDA
jgi:hypothetical protein